MALPWPLGICTRGSGVLGQQASGESRKNPRDHGPGEWTLLLKSVTEFVFSNVQKMSEFSRGFAASCLLLLTGF